MLKKIMKAALAASLVFGMSSFAYAADGLKVGASAAEYFGQWNTGAENYTAHMVSVGEAKIKLNGTLGKMMLYHDVEYRYGPDGNMSTATSGEALKQEPYEVQTRLSYPLPFGLFSIGNVVNIATIPFEAGAGFKTSKVPGSTDLGLAFAGYSEKEGLQLHVPLEGMGFIQLTLRDTAFNWTHAAGGDALAYLAANIGGYATGAAAGTYTTAAADAANAVGFGLLAAEIGAATLGNYEGSMYQLGANLAFGPLGVRLGYTTSENDDPQVEDYKSLSTTGQLLGVQFNVNKGLYVFFNYGAGKISQDALTDDFKMTSMALGAGVAAGPGKLIARYEADAFGFDEVLLDIAKLTLCYDISLTKGSGVQLAYSSATKTYHSDMDYLGAHNKAFDSAQSNSFIGGGLYAYF